MRKISSFLLASMLLVSGNALAQEKKSAEKLVFTPVVELPTTSVKNQHRSGTCWAFSSLGFFECELLRTTGKTYDLCESYLVYKTMIDRAIMRIRTHGDVSFSQGGSFYDAVYCLENYGICPQEAMAAPGSLYGDTLFNHTEVDMIAAGYLDAILKAKPKQLSTQWSKGLYGIYDAYLGELPTEFTYEGKTYTPKSFAESLKLNMDDYISLTSYLHHPFYKPFVLEIQDNWRSAQSWNLPLDEFMEVMDNAIRKGYTFAWGADVSEPNFGRTGDNAGVATVPANAKNNDMSGSDMLHWIGGGQDKAQTELNTKGEMVITPELRQEGYDNWTTTDDHGMVIYGIAKDQNGKEYFMMKNSWGNYNQFGGRGYISKAYMAYKTMNILVHKKAIPSKILKKLGI